MAAVWNNESKPQTMDAIVAGSRFTNAKMMLLGGAIASISQGDSYATLAAFEVAFTGYARQSVSGWSPASLSANKGTTVSATLAFTNSGGSASPTIKGWALVDDTNSKIIVADLYTTPFTIAAGTAYATAAVLTYTGDATVTP